MKRLSSASRLLLVLLWLLGTRAARSADPSVTALAFTPGGDQVVTGSQGGIQIFGWPGLQPSGELKTSLENIHDLAFSPEGKLLAAAGGSPGESGVLEVFDWQTGESVGSSRLHDDVIYAVGWHKDGRLAATAGSDLLVSLVEIPALVSKGILQGHSRPVMAVCFADGGDIVISASADQSIRIWDPSTLLELRSLTNHTGPVTGLKVRPSDGAQTSVQLASIGADRTVRFWQPAVGRLVRFARLKSEPLALDWYPDGSRLVVACRDGAIRVVDPASAEIVGELRAVDGWAYSVGVSPRGDAAAVGGQNGELRRVSLPQWPDLRP